MELEVKVGLVTLLVLKVETVDMTGRVSLVEEREVEFTSEAFPKGTKVF